MHADNSNYYVSHAPQSVQSAINFTLILFALSWKSLITNLLGNYELV